jgi:hypothetical protein
MVNSHNRRAAFAGAPAPGLLGGVLPVAPVGFNQMLTDYIKPEQTFIVCPNQDVTYGAGVTALDKDLTVVQVPDFGDRTTATRSATAGSRSPMLRSLGLTT